MSRRTRRAQRQLRRGHARREPLLLVADDRADLIEWIEWATRVGYRYRSELVPLMLAGTLWITAAILNGNQLPPWWALLATAPTAGGLCWPRVAPLLRPIERGYVVAITVLSGAWLTAAAAFGPSRPPLPLVLLVGTIAGGVPWWAHRR